MSTSIAAIAVIPHGGPAIAIFVGCLLSAVIAAIVAMEAKRPPVVWAVVAFVAVGLALSVMVDLLTS
jgi:hydroxyethylthiazole kinase-like sugar kinase family protein